MQLTRTEINALLDRYFEGETTLTEEQQLRDYFTATTVPAELAHFAPMFRVYAEAREARTSDDFESRLMERLQAEVAPRPVAKVRRLGRTWQRIAAAVLLLAASLYGIHQCNQWSAQTATVPTYNGPVASATIDWSKYEVTDEAEALRITRAALGITSKQLNQTSQQTAASVHTQLSKVLQ